MINFRFHVVSLVAVFLALAVGIVMGYGVFAQPTFEGLQDRIDSVERRADAIKEENQALRGDVERLGGALDGVADFAVGNRLTDTALYVMAVRGVQEDAVGRAVSLARQAGAEVPGILWLEGRWALRRDEDVTALATAVGTFEGRRSVVRAQAWKALADQLVNRPEVGESPSDTQLLVRLVQEGFVTLTSVGDETPDVEVAGLNAVDPHFLLAVGTDGEVPSANVVAPLARALAEARAALVVGEVAGASGERGSVVAPIRQDDTLASMVSTVDDLELREGALAAVLALADLSGSLFAESIIGHYGFGADAQRLLPEWSQQ